LEGIVMRTLIDWLRIRKERARAERRRQGFDYAAGELLRGVPVAEVEVRVYDSFYRDSFNYGMQSAILAWDRLHCNLQFKAKPWPAPAAEPIDMVLHCPKCGTQHIDAPEPVAMPSDTNDMPAWVNPPHRSHLCHGCGHIWRPADVPTNGVAAVKTKGKDDSPVAAPVATPASESPQPLTMPTDEQVDARIIRIMEAGGLTTNLCIRARAAIAEFCRLNGIGAPHD
jgi:hypothetical protein